MTVKLDIFHENVLGKIRKEFDDAKHKGLVIIDFRPNNNRLDIGFADSVDLQMIDRVCEYVRKNYDRIQYQVFRDEWSQCNVMRIMNMRAEYKLEIENKTYTIVGLDELLKGR